MGFYGLVAVGIGAALGAWLRWWLGLLLNPLLPELPLGTLSANVVGGYLMGLAMAYFAHHAGLSPEARLFVMTGFLGGLTTFSTFSAEVVTLLSRLQLGWAAAAVALHVAGSVAATLLGIYSFKLMKG